MSKQKRSGFTIIELTIAVTFLSILMMAIVSLTITVGKMYIKGNTNKTINQAGRDVSDIIRRDLLSSGISIMSPMVTTDTGEPNTTSVSGRMCLGNVTYLWNTADLLNDTSPAASAITITSDGKPIRFVRIVHPNGAYCDVDASGDYPVQIRTDETFTELLDGTTADFGIYNLDFVPISTSGDKGVYQVKYTLGTNGAGTTEVDPSGYIVCKPDNSLLANFNYCSVTDFDMMLRIGGTK